MRRWGKIKNRIFPWQGTLLDIDWTTWLLVVLTEQGIMHNYQPDEDITIQASNTTPAYMTLNRHFQILQLAYECWLAVSIFDTTPVEQDSYQDTVGDRPRTCIWKSNEIDASI